MRIRLRLLVTSFNKAASDYALARLECALANPGAPAPPVVNRLGPNARLEGEVAQRWPQVHGQVRMALAYIGATNRPSTAVGNELAWARLTRAVRLLSQFAQSIEWIGLQPRVDAAGESGS